MKILITGGLGFIGSHLADRLAETHKVVIVDDLSSGSLDNLNRKSILYLTDVVSFCQSHDNDFDVIFHFGNYARVTPSFNEPYNVINKNVGSTAAIIEFASKNKSKLIYASSSTTLFMTRDNNPYTFSKFLCEDMIEYIRGFGLKATNIHFFNVYGSERESNNTLIKILKNKYRKGEPLTVVGDGTKERDFTHIDDTIDALEILLYQEEYIEHYEIGSGVCHRIIDVVKEFKTNINFIEERYHEHSKSLSYPNVIGYKPKRDLLNHIQEFLEGIKNG